MASPTLSDVLTTGDILNRMPPPDPLADPKGYVASYLRRRGQAPSPKLSEILNAPTPAVEPNLLGRALSYVPPEAMLAANFIAPNVRLPVPRVANPIRAYHGSPHDFDKFDLAKVGTGEGVQSYGHGLYFAESEPVARSYRDAHRPAQMFATNPRFQQWMKENGRPMDGRMYEVALHATPEQFLDWDKPLGVQSQLVQAAMNKVMGAPPPVRSSAPTLYERHQREFMMPDAALAGLRYRRGRDNDEIARAFSDASVPGIRYLDQGSRNGAQGTSNYVVWNPEIIEIIRKYGLAAPVGGATLASVLRDEAQQ